MSNSSDSSKKCFKPLRIAVLVSGGGTNLQAIIDEEQRINSQSATAVNLANANNLDTSNGVDIKGADSTSAVCPYTVVLVVSSSKEAFALERAKKAGIPAIVASPYSVMGAQNAKVADRDEKRLAVSDKVLELCRDYKVDAVVLAGFLTVLSGQILKDYSNRIINLHPALLPKFGGVGMWGHHVHEAVLASGEKESGCTIHLVDSGCDTGEILLQRKVPVIAGDTPETLYARIAPLEHEAMVTGIKVLAEKLNKE